MNSKPKRSKNGCRTCRERKVKCDELKPCCTKCREMRLSCRWNQGSQTPLKTARRGSGPTKSRKGAWRPRPIAPHPGACGISPQFSPERDDNTITDRVSSSHRLELEPGEFDAAMTFAPGALFDGFDLGGLEHINQCHDYLNPQKLLTTYDCSALTISPSFSSLHVSLPNSMILTIEEHQALRHYQTTYSLYRTTKDPEWSTHKVLLHMASTNEMIMHLLLAVSINDWSLRNSRAVFDPDNAEVHFQAGSRMMEKAAEQRPGYDVVTMMAAYFFMYLHESKRKTIARHRLDELSATVLNHVKGENLLSDCINFAAKETQADATAMLSAQDRSLLARLIMWTLDEDVKCNFRGSGGYFVRYFIARHSDTKELYDASRNALSDHWGPSYPHFQLLDDDQNSIVLEFLWAMTPLWQDINDVSEGREQAESKCRIERTFKNLEQKYSSVFRHSSETATKPRPRILVNADYDVVLFNALQVYYFRSTMSDLDWGADARPEIKQYVETILTIVERTFESRGTELHDRLQWPLFLAGIETQNPIYRSWIKSRLSTDSAVGALQRTLDAQELAGRRLKMVEIRELLSFSEAPALLSSHDDYISGILTV